MSTNREAISTTASPAAIGPYSQAIRTDQLVFTSGQIPLDPATGVLVSEDFQRQAEQVMDNLEAVLIAAGSSFDRVVKILCFLTDLGNFPIVNEVFERRLNKPFPARSCVEVSALPKGASVEVEAIALTGR